MRVMFWMRIERTMLSGTFMKKQSGDLTILLFMEGFLQT